MRIGSDIVAWFAASKALTNVLKHAGPARIWLSAVTEAGGRWFGGSPVNGGWC